MPSKIIQDNNTSFAMLQIQRNSLC